MDLLGNGNSMHYVCEQTVQTAYATAI